MIVHIKSVSSYEVVAYVDGLGESGPHREEKAALGELCLILAVKLQETQRMLEDEGMSEVWVPVPGWGGIYSVSTLGRVRRDRRGRGARRGWVLKPWTMPSGHLQVNLHRDGQRSRLVHRLVCEAFHGPCPEGMECRHLDNDPTNNQPDNLRWGTRKENEADKVEHGTDNRGSRHGMSKLTEDEVAAMRREHAVGDLTQKELAKKYGVASSLVSRIVTRKIWKHVD